MSDPTPVTPSEVLAAGEIKTNLVTKFFKNNGYLRGMLYFLLSALPLLGERLEVWSKTPPANKYEIAAMLIGALTAGLVAVRAYLDQHLSRTKSGT